MDVKITHGGGYDPRLGREHPSNQDPTLEHAFAGDGADCATCGKGRAHYLHDQALRDPPIRDEVRAVAREVEDLAVQLKAALTKSARLWNRGGLTARERRELNEAQRAAEKAVL